MIKRVNNKAFTLIELLAVIVILAVILAIAVPRVLNVIEESDKEAFRITGESLIRGAKERLIYDMRETVEGKTYTIEDGAFVGDSIPMTGELPDNGTINVSREGITSMAISNDKWCAIKNEDSDNIIVSKDIDCVLYIPEVVPESCFSVVNNMNELTITDYDSSCSKNPIIPSTIGGLPVKKIGSSSFSYSSLTSVIIPNSVTSIGSQAFYLNRLTSLTIPNSVTSIDYYAFYNNQLTNVKISNSITLIREGLFGYNNLTSVTIPNGVTSIQNSAFSYNQLKSLTIPDSVTSIGAYSFNDNQLTNVIIPDSVTSIGSYSFKKNQLIDVAIPTSVTYIGEAAFNDNQLPINKAIIYERDYDGSENTSTIVSYGGAKRDSVVIPSGVTSIERAAFWDNQIENVTIPITVTSIREEAFSQNQLTSVIIPNDVEILEDSAFAWNQLTSVTIPEGFEMSDGYGAQISDSFSYSYNTLYLKAGGTYTSFCQDCDWIHSTLPAPVIPDTPTACFSYTSTATNVTITGYDGSCTKYVKIPGIIGGKPVEHIGDSAFEHGGCVKFNSNENKMLAYNNNNVFEKENDISINKLLATISGCSGIKKVILPNTLKTIGNDAFYNNELTQVIIPNGVTSIGDSAFDQYYSIYSITMPGNIIVGDIMGYYDRFKEIYDDYYSKAAGVYMRNGCGWINSDSALPYPENLCK